MPELQAVAPPQGEGSFARSGSAMRNLKSSMMHVRFPVMLLRPRGIKLHFYSFLVWDVGLLSW